MLPAPVRPYSRHVADLSRPLVTIYSKPDCHLCDVAKERVASLRSRLGFDVVVVDITGDPDLAARYAERIPVVTVDAEEVAVYRVSRKRLSRKLAEAGARRRWWARILPQAD